MFMFIESGRSVSPSSHLLPVPFATARVHTLVYACTHPSSLLPRSPFVRSFVRSPLCRSSRHLSRHQFQPASERASERAGGEHSRAIYDPGCHAIPPKWGKEAPTRLPPSLPPSAVRRCVRPKVREKEVRSGNSRRQTMPLPGPDLGKQRRGHAREGDIFFRRAIPQSKLNLRFCQAVPRESRRLRCLPKYGMGLIVKNSGGRAPLFSSPLLSSRLFAECVFAPIKDDLQ